MSRRLVFPQQIPQIHADAGEDLAEVIRAIRILSGLIKDFHFDPSSLIHQKRDLLCLRDSGRTSAPLSLTDQDEPNYSLP